MKVDASQGPAIARVQRAIENLAPSWYGPGASLAHSPTVAPRAWSTHFLATVNSSDRDIDLVIKIPLWDEAPDLATALAAGPQESTRAEYETLGQIEAMVAASADPGLAAVRRVAYVDEINAVVTEKLDAVPLRRLRGPVKTGAGPAIGRWLRRFHDEIGGASDARFESAMVAGDLDELEHRANAVGPVLEDAVASLRAQADGLRGTPVRIATTHGDLGPSNVLVTPDGRVAVIDPNMVEGPAGSDLAKLAVALRTSRARLLGGWALGRRMHPVEAAALEGYGDVTPEIYDLCRRIAATRRWLDVEEAGSGSLRRLALPLARRVFSAEVASAPVGA